MGFSIKPAEARVTRAGKNLGFLEKVSGF